MWFIAVSYVRTLRRGERNGAEVRQWLQNLKVYNVALSSNRGN